MTTQFNSNKQVVIYWADGCWTHWSDYYNNTHEWSHKSDDFGRLEFDESMSDEEIDNKVLELVSFKQGICDGC